MNATATITDFNTKQRWVPEDFNEHKDWIVPRGFLTIDGVKTFFSPPKERSRGVRQSDLLAFYLICSVNRNERHGIVKRTFDQNDLIGSVGLKGCQPLDDYDQANAESLPRRKENFVRILGELLTHCHIKDAFRTDERDISFEDNGKVSFVVDFTGYDMKNGNMINYHFLKSLAHDYDAFITYLAMCLLRDAHGNVRKISNFVDRAFEAKTKQQRYKKTKKVREAIGKINRYAMLQKDAAIKISDESETGQKPFDLFSIALISQHADGYDRATRPMTDRLDRPTRLKNQNMDTEIAGSDK